MRWKSDWLSHLQSRPKWAKEAENLQVNDLVLIKDDRLPSNQWAKGRIIELHPGDDQLVRVVTVRTTDGQYRRCISKISKLPNQYHHSIITINEDPIKFKPMSKLHHHKIQYEKSQIHVVHLWGRHVQSREQN